MSEHAQCFVRRRAGWLRQSMAALLAAVTVFVAAAPAAAADETVKLVGAGASFPAPLYLRWFRDYHALHPNVKPDYQSLGSGGGINDFIDGRIDFAGADVSMTDEQLERVQDGVVQIPMAAGAIVVVFNVDGLSDLKLTRDALVGIFTGRIERWNDPAIASANPGAELPDSPITIVARADSSGTTYHMTRHLSALSDEFAEQIGTTMSPNWPKSLKQRGMLVRGRGNDGVAALVRAMEGSIGYVQYAYAYLTNMTMASLQNRAGSIVAPSNESFVAALDAMETDLTTQAATDPPGEDSYPIIALSWLMIHKHYDDPKKLPVLIDLINYCLGPGQARTEQLGYIHFPPEATAHVRGLLEPLK